jgi:hypothetical protein
MSNDPSTVADQPIDPADVPPLQPGEVPVGLTREEVGILLRHWHEKVIGYEHFEFIAQQSMWRDKYYANGRARRMEGMLGEADADAVMDEVERNWRINMGNERWRIFRKGTAEEVDQLRGEDAAEDHRCYQKLADPGPAAAFLREHPDRVYLDDDGDMWFWVLDQRGEPIGNRPELYLTIRTPRSGSLGSAVKIPMPDGWSPPYGLSRCAESVVVSRLGT